MPCYKCHCCGDWEDMVSEECQVDHCWRLEDADTRAENAEWELEIIQFTLENLAGPIHWYDLENLGG